MADKNVIMEDTFSFMERSMNDTWDLWLKGLKNCCLAQDQMEDMLRKQLGHNKAMRDEWSNMVQDMNKQLNGNHQQYWNMVKKAMQGDLNQFNPFETFA